MIKETSIKNDNGILIVSNIKRLREAKGMKSGDLVRQVHLKGTNITAFSLSKIEANTQHIKASQLKAIKESLNCSYEELFASDEE